MSPSAAGRCSPTTPAFTPPPSAISIPTTPPSAPPKSIPKSPPSPTLEQDSGDKSHQSRRPRWEQPLRQRHPPRFPRPLRRLHPPLRNLHRRPQIRGSEIQTPANAESESPDLTPVFSFRAGVHIDLCKLPNQIGLYSVQSRLHLADMIDLPIFQIVRDSVVLVDE